MKIAVASLVVLAAAAATPAVAFDDVEPVTAYALATSDPDVYILDVRTAPEWQWVGHPGKNKLGEGGGLTGKVVNVSYQIDHQGSFVVNPSFLADVNELFGSNPDVVLITMCRSGHRSALAAAALEAAGYRAMNMVTGFEGGTDGSGYRTVNGWKVLNLPYTFGGAAYAD